MESCPESFTPIHAWCFWAVILASLSFMMSRERTRLWNGNLQSFQDHEYLNNTLATYNDDGNCSYLVLTVTLTQLIWRRPWYFASLTSSRMILRFSCQSTDHTWSSKPIQDPQKSAGEKSGSNIHTKLMTPGEHSDGKKLPRRKPPQRTLRYTSSCMESCINIISKTPRRRVWFF